MKRQTLYLLSACAGAALCQSCVPLAAGAAGGYLLHKEGYRVQNPVKKADVKLRSPVVKQPKESAPNYSDPVYPSQSY